MTFAVAALSEHILSSCYTEINNQTMKKIRLMCTSHQICSFMQVRANLTQPLGVYRLRSPARTDDHILARVDCQSSWPHQKSSPSPKFPLPHMHSMATALVCGDAHTLDWVLTGCRSRDLPELERSADLCSCGQRVEGRGVSV